MTGSGQTNYPLIIPAKLNWYYLKQEINICISGQKIELSKSMKYLEDIILQDDLYSIDYWNLHQSQQLWKNWAEALVSYQKDFLFVFNIYIYIKYIKIFYLSLIYICINHWRIFRSSIKSWPEWDLNPWPLNSIQML